MRLSSAPMTVLPHCAWPPKASLAKKNMSNGTPLVAFRELAKEVVEKCTKGRFIRVYGYLHHSNGGNDGQYKTEVIATRIKYLERKK